MTETAKELANMIDSIKEGSQNSSEMTHVFKEFGNGKMRDALSRAKDIFYDEGKTDGQKEGSVFGVLGTLVVVGLGYGIYWCVEKHKKKKAAHEEEAKKLIQELESMDLIENNVSGESNQSKSDENPNTEISN